MKYFFVCFWQGGLSAAPARAVSAVKNMNLPEIPRNINIGDINIKVPSLSPFWVCMSDLGVFSLSLCVDIHCHRCYLPNAIYGLMTDRHMKTLTSPKHTTGSYNLQRTFHFRLWFVDRQVFEFWLLCCFVFCL